MTKTFRLRARYTLTERSTIVQDMVFYADSPQIDFETVVDWDERHRLLKTVFDVSVRSEYATQEIQFGCVRRPTTRNNIIEQARFETCNHKYTDLSEPGYGVAVLNDCKYGISVNDSAMSLTLLKSGTRPDPRGDKGRHSFTYSLLPHEGGFRAETVVRAGYLLNHPMFAGTGRTKYPTLMRVSAPNVIVEAVKPSEDGGRMFVVRMYEAEGSFTHTDIEITDCVHEIRRCDLLERPGERLESPRFTDTFRPFEIKSYLVEY